MPLDTDQVQRFEEWDPYIRFWYRHSGRQYMPVTIVKMSIPKSFPDWKPWDRFLGQFSDKEWRLFTGLTHSWRQFFKSTL